MKIVCIILCFSHLVKILKSGAHRYTSHRAEALVDYSQSHILTSNEHVDKLHTILEKKEQIAQEKEKRRMEKEFIKHARAAEKKKQREAKEKKGI